MSDSGRGLEPDAADFREQYRAGMEGAIALDRSHLSSLVVTGKDREAFLHNMLSGDIRKLSPGEGRPASFLTTKGKLVSDILVLADADRFYLDVELERAEPLRATLDRYIISEDVSLVRDEPGDETRFSVEGPEAADRLAALLEGPSPTELSSLGHLSFLWARYANDPLRIVAHRKDPSPRFDVTGRPSAAAALLDALVDEKLVVRASSTVRETRRIEAGRARFGIDVSENDMPLEAGLDDAVSFDKGCYIGQEYVVRLAHRGHLNRKLSGLLLKGAEPPVPGTTVSAEGRDDVGRVTSAAFSPTLDAAIALAWLRREVFEPGTAVRAGETDAVVTSLPFLLH